MSRQSQAKVAARYNRWSIFISMTALAAAFASVADAAASRPVKAARPLSPFIEQKWQDFQNNPVQFMNTLPPKKGATTLAPRFSPTDIKGNAFVTKKSLSRTTCDESGVCMQDILEGRAAARESSQDFFDLREFTAGTPIYRLEEMDAANLLQSSLPETPWSDTYWPLYMGGLGARYADGHFLTKGNWKGYYDFITSEDSSLKRIADNGDELDTLSPSEKYDLLIGDLTANGSVYEHGYLTPFMWNEGKAYWDDKGEVEGWMGLCHGWAPAAYMAPRPTKTVETVSADGRSTLKFYPSDIKGLTTYLWAKARTPSRFIGGRCNDKDAKVDEESGRILDEKCFDTNPANWHTIIVNQIGVAKKSFVMDATYDYQVWNQPVYSYSYSYFNPKTGKAVGSLDEAKVELSDFRKDKFKKFRSRHAVAVVGIEMEVTYVVETRASHAEYDSADRDAVSSVTYMYDIELDEDGNMIGGEWYHNAHPDFLWSPAAGARAESYGDSRVTATDWDGTSPLPAFWKDIAVQTALRTGLPLASIVEGLTAASNR
ncbi:MAG: hypothetical protein JNJ49_09895 [Bdellovibrionaceae bacterium]|nr:hypothetical protein [Pseudobdellovibrionaceae bacterium]